MAPATHTDARRDRLAAGHLRVVERVVADAPLQAALRRVAAEVARDDLPERVHAIIAEEAGRLLKARVTRVQGPRADAEGAAHVLSVPITAAGYGPACALVAARDGGPFGPEEIEQLRSFADLSGIAMVGEAHLHRLSQHARTDPLTGLANHRVFQERLVEAVEEARLRGAPLSLALFNVDDFRDVNEVHGHRAGDALLLELARRMSRVPRSGDVLARLGSDAFALIAPGLDDGAAAELAAGVGREVGHDAGPAGTRVTIAAGVAELGPEDDPAGLMSRADEALHRAKHAGGDRVVRWRPDGMTLSAEQRAAAAARLRALAGVRALARAVDAKDASTLRHSERVAALSGRLARELGWSEERAEMLHAAALIHDVGKIGVPDRVLLKRRPLTTADWGRLYQHPMLGAQIAAELLTAEQVTWIHQHHERVDGEGYPDGLPGAHISDGGRLLALADAWDAMTSVRAYREPFDVDQALAECRACVGSQFSPEAVTALEALHARGDLPGPGE